MSLSSKKIILISSGVMLIGVAVLFGKSVFADIISNLTPVSDGTYIQWTPVLGRVPHYTMVDEFASCNGNTDYNYAVTVGNRDSYDENLSSIPNDATITKIEIIPCASRNSTGTGSSTINVFYRYNGVDSADAGNYVLAATTTPTNLSYTAFNGLSLLKIASSTLEIGVVYSSGNKGAKLSRIAARITYTPATPPTVTTTAATNIETTSSTLNGSANPNGIYSIGWFRYSTSTPGSCNNSFGIRTPLSGGVNLGSGTSSVPFSQGVSGLTPSTTYYYCAIASSTSGVGYGSILSFATDPLVPPTVVTNAATNITNSSSTLNGAANPNGIYSIGWFRYSTSSPGSCNDSFGVRAPSSWGVSLGSGTSSVPYSQGVSGLTPSTTYYYCAIASSTSGIGYGSVMSFATDPLVPPTVITNAATNTTNVSSTLNGSANPNGIYSIGWFRYSTSTPGSCNNSFGVRAPSSWGVSLGSGTSSVPFSQGVSGLTPSTTYYYCAIASSTSGVGYGSVVSFATTP